jgi:hypothetical protein
VPARPEFEATLTKGIHYAAGLTIFAPPVALFAVPSAFLGTPIFRLIDRVMYTKDQHNNTLYYWILDCAHPWVKENIAKQAKKLCPDYDAVLVHVNSLNQRLNEKAKQLDNFYPGQKLKQIRDSLMFRKDKLGDEKYNSLNAILDVVERDASQLKRYADKIQQMTITVDGIAEYMIAYNKQLRANDGRFHARDYDVNNQFNHVLLADLPRRLNVAFEVEFNVTHAHASTLMNDISSRLNSVNTDSQETVRRVRENQESQKTRAQQLELNARRLF